MKHAAALTGAVLACALATQAGAAGPSRLSESTVIVIDAQREYLDGDLPLEGLEEALADLSILLSRARAAGAKVVHVRHHSRPGSQIFDPDSPYVDILPEAAPALGEPVVTKRYPDSFKATELESVLRGLGRNRLVLAGFMTQQCVAATAESARDRGYDVTVVAASTAARQMPDPSGSGPIPAAQVKQRALDRLARVVTVVPAAEQVPQ